MKRHLWVQTEPKQFGGGVLYVEHGSWSDGDRKEAEGVTPLWTVFHLYNYFWRYFANFGFMAKFSGKKAKLGAETPEKSLTQSPQASAESGRLLGGPKKFLNA